MPYTQSLEPLWLSAIEIRVFANNYSHLALYKMPWWRHQMKTFSAFLALFERNHPALVDSLYKGSVTRSFDDFFHLRLKIWLSKKPRRGWFETPSRRLWCHCNVFIRAQNGAWTSGWVNNRDAGDVRRHCAHYDVIVMECHTWWRHGV